MVLDWSSYTGAHARELRALLDSPAWQQAIRSGLVDEVCAERLEPGRARDFVATVVTQLERFNGEQVRDLIAQGCSDRSRLISVLARWSGGLEGKDPLLSFLGLNVTSRCNFEPRCIYCNQALVESRVGLEGWKHVIEEATSEGASDGPYVYITGGEPLLLGHDIWGDDGLVHYATARGAMVNVNTNATLITPIIALRLIKAGLGRLHISLDTSDRDLQNELCAGDQYDRILRGIYNIQIARDLVGVSYPIIHTNCVLSNTNVASFPQLLAFLLAKTKQTADPDDPFFNDLFPHLIPVGGATNAYLRPSENEFRGFYEQVWSQACAVWDEHQGTLGMPQSDRAPLGGFFSNPFLRVQHQGGLDAYVKASAEGRYGRLALARRCYVAPTQASFTPDGYQFRCGSHAIRRILAIGNILEGGLFDNIREGLSGLGDLPQEETCYGCALATLHINQTVESKLSDKVNTWLSV